MRSIVIVITAVVVLSVVAAYSFLGNASTEESKDAQRPHSALIVSEALHSEEGVAQTTAISIVGQKHLERLESLFPNYQRLPVSNVAGGWKAGWRVYFNFANGNTIRVTVSGNDNGKTWSIGKGDFRTKGSFEALLKDLNKLAPRKGS